MKILSNIRILLLSLMLLAVASGVQRVNAQPGISVSFQQFYDELSPYGEWVDDPEYGYIWVPNVEPDFQPYATNGRWIMTDYGNTWVSNYNWGWAPFHYGRWNYHNRFGWSWVPGYEWGPAWVNWRTGGGYYGWAPLGPGMSIGVSINIPTNYWVFVPQRYLLSTSIHRYYAPRRNVVNVYNRTTIINNTYVHNNRTYVSGPRRSDIQRITRTNVPVHRITNASRPGSSRVTGRSVEIYRPNVSRNEQARPSRITASNNVRATNNGNRSVSSSRSSTVRSNGTTNGNERITSSRTPATGTRTQRDNRETNGTTQGNRPAANTRSTNERSNSRSTSTVAPNRQPAGATGERAASPRASRPSVNRSGSSTTSSSRPERSTPQRTETPTPQRTERSAPQQQRMERSSPQRTERASPQRVERPSSSSSRSSSPRGSEGSSRPSRSTRG